MSRSGDVSLLSLSPISLSLEELAVFSLGTYYSKCGPWTAASVSPGSLVKSPILGHQNLSFP